MSDPRNESGLCPYGSYGAHTYNYECTECIWCGPNRLALAPGKWISNGDGTDSWSSQPVSQTAQGYPPDSGWQQNTSPI